MGSHWFVAGLYRAMSCSSAPPPRENVSPISKSPSGSAMTLSIRPNDPPAIRSCPNTLHAPVITLNRATPLVNNPPASPQSRTAITSPFGHKVSSPTDPVVPEPNADQFPVAKWYFATPVARTFPALSKRPPTIMSPSGSTTMLYTPPAMPGLGAPGSYCRPHCAAAGARPSSATTENMRDRTCTPPKRVCIPNIASSACNRPPPHLWVSCRSGFGTSFRQNGVRERLRAAG